MNVGKISGSMRNNINTSTATASIAEQWINNSVFRESETGIFEKNDKFRPVDIAKDEHNLSKVLFELTDEPAVNSMDVVFSFMDNADKFCTYEDGRFVGIGNILDWLDQNRLYLDDMYFAYIEKSTLDLEIEDDYNESSDKGILIINATDVEDYEREYLGL